MSERASILHPASTARATRWREGPALAIGSAVRLAVPAMGTRFEFVLFGDGERFLRAVGESAVREVLDQHRRLSAFDPSSHVSRINREAARREVAVDGELFDLLAACVRLTEQTRGCFDVTMGPLMRAWGFRDRHADPGAIEQALELTGSRQLTLDRPRGTVRFEREGMSIDLGGIAKGFALDQAAQLLRDAGVGSAFMHGGTSTAVAIGPGAEGDPWSIRLGRRSSAPIASLCDGALSVSAPHGRIVSSGDQTIGHVLDPRTGRSAMNCAQAIATHSLGTVAEAWSTALLVLSDPPRWMPGSVQGGVERLDGAWRWSNPGPSLIRPEGSDDDD